MADRRRPTRQLLFEDLLPAVDTDSVQSKLQYDKMHVSQATFKGGMTAAVHRWFRLTPSFGPELVQEMLSEMGASSTDTVLDPFSGAGTTLIQCQLQKLASFGFEINPFLYFVADTSLNWDLGVLVLQDSLSSICNEFNAKKGSVTWENLADFGLLVPPIHNPTRWWRQDVLVQILVLKSIISTKCRQSQVRSFFMLALAGVLIPHMTNVTLGRLQLHFIDKSDAIIDVLGLFSRHASQMIEDMSILRDSNLARTARVYMANSTKLDEALTKDRASIVITSPPYPNRYSYVWNTRPYLYLFDLFSSPKEASNLDLSTIGGTWGTATSTLQKGAIKPSSPIVDHAISSIASEIRQQDNLMANYLMKYFNDLSLQLIEMEKVIKRSVKIAYVVGCSRLKGVYVETDVLLAQIIEGLGLGYKVNSVRRIRKRHSGKDLHESIVYASK
jgi:hypothetical protein